MKTQTALAYTKETALNAICPYFTMFPLEYPLKILRKEKSSGRIVLDPFCGRGTTLFAARQLHLQAWGIDSSPIAVAIAKAKLAACEPDQPIRLAREILQSSAPKNIPDTAFFRTAYHPSTLRQICALREWLAQLEVDTDESTILRAAALGCLHGPLPKDIKNAGYFSNQMPRTYASKPSYAVAFWQKKGLTPPQIDVLDVLQRKVKRLVGLSHNSANSIHQVVHGDAQLASSYSTIPSPPSVVITSPPYYGMRTYVQDQWLRNWFLGGPPEVDYTSGVKLPQSSQAIFAKALGRVWNNIAECCSTDVQMYIRFGTIPSAPVDVKGMVRQSLEESGVEWRIVSVRAAASAKAGRRQADQMRTQSNPSVEYDFHIERR